MDTVLPEPVPKGFTLVSEPGDAVVIEHRRTGSGKGCAMVFVFTTWLGGWLAFAVVLAAAFRRGETAEDGTPIPSWLVIGFWLVGIAVAHYFASHIFGRRVFRLDGHQLVHEQISPLSRRRERIPRESVQALVQTEYRDEEANSISSWDLQIQTPDGYFTLLYHHQYEKSEWLGQVLAQWAEVPYVPAAPKYEYRPLRLE
ncbi:MAG: hypothetical protein HN380_24170 [Victivallales bacterium]|jgi:hypothetical protein|nr:hypothetical protein [Victivallales bacterium]